MRHDLLLKVSLRDKVGVDRGERLLPVHLGALLPDEVQSGLLAVLLDDWLPFFDVIRRGLVRGFALDAFVDDARERNGVGPGLLVREAIEPPPRRADGGGGGAFTRGRHERRDGETRRGTRVGEVALRGGSDGGTEAELALDAVLGDAALEPALPGAAVSDDVGDERRAGLLVDLVVLVLVVFLVIFPVSGGGLGVLILVHLVFGVGFLFFG